MAARILPQIKEIDKPDGLPQTRREALALSEKLFFTGVPCLHGHLAPRRARHGDCIVCLRESQRRAVRVRRTSYPHPDDRIERLRRSDPRVLLFQWARHRAKKKGIEFSLSPDDVIVPENCPVCRVRLTFEARGFAHDDTMTLDRAD